MTLSPYWKEALRIDFEPRVLMKDRLVAKKIELQKAKVKGINKGKNLLVQAAAITMSILPFLFLRECVVR